MAGRFYGDAEGSGTQVLREGVSNLTYDPLQYRGGESITMKEISRLILGLRAAGWSEEKINNFLLYIESGDESLKPTEEK